LPCVLLLLLLDAQLFFYGGATIGVQWKSPCLPTELQDAGPDAVFAPYSRGAPTTPSTPCLPPRPALYRRYFSVKDAYEEGLIDKLVPGYSLNRFRKLRKDMAGDQETFFNKDKPKFRFKRDETADAA
jgi:hypothetical protein